MGIEMRSRARVSYLALGLIAMTSTVQAAPKGEWDRCIQKLCTSTSQSDCWIKAAAAMCDRDQIQCKELPDHAPAKVLRHVGNRWEVLTQYGKGWVSDRMMMINGSMCPELGQ